MKRKTPIHGSLRDALASLIRSQSMLVEAEASRDRQLAEIRRESEEARREAAKEADAARREMAEIERRTDERVNRIEAILLRLVEVLPDAVRGRIGIKPEPQT